MPVETPADLAGLDLQVVKLAPEPRPAPAAGKLLWGLVGFVALWVLFCQLWQALPYLSSGSDVVFRTKVQAELRGEAFRGASGNQTKVLIFGTSKILSGFIPDEFDQAGARTGLSIFSFNSGYPARDSFVPELESMTKHGTIPDVLLLTEAWGGEPAASVFQPIGNEHALAETIFPFRHLLRDAANFIGNARQHGGAMSYYRMAQKSVEQMMTDRGYYFIAEQSHYPHDRLPDNFSLPTDSPSHIAARKADPQAPEASELENLIAKYRLTCFYVPAYARSGAVASASSDNVSFRTTVEAVGCKTLGPDYFTYPNSFFSDELHLNREGAKVFTADLFQTVREALSDKHAVQ
jgi:hypothetical protein